MADTRERVYYVHDLDNNENILKRLDFHDCFQDAKKMNKKEGRKRYVCKGAWVIHINRG